MAAVATAYAVMLAIMKPVWDHIRKNIRLIAIRLILAIIMIGFLSFVYSGYLLLFEKPREWRREAAPFEAMGARVGANGGGDMGYLAGREGVARIYRTATLKLDLKARVFGDPPGDNHDLYGQPY
jgi:hypothetical protein